MTENMKTENEEELLRDEQQSVSEEQQAAEKQTAEAENQTDETTQPENGEEQTESEEPLTVEQQLEKANAEIADLNDRLLRKIAEFENYRKRTLKEKTELILNGGEKTITAILPVLDDMERALKNKPEGGDAAAILEGVELIFKKFNSILEHQGVRRIETEGADFNVDLHEAIAQLPAPSDELKGKVLDCTLTGYTMNDKVIRHAQVVVGL